MERPSKNTIMNMNETHTKAQQGADGPSLAGPRSAAQAAAAVDTRCTNVVCSTDGAGLRGR